MATYSSVQDRVEARLIDMPATIVAEIPMLVNDAYRKLQVRHNFKIMEALLSTTTTASTRTLVDAIPTDLKEWRGKPYWLSDAGTPTKIVWAPNLTSLQPAFGSDDVGFPQVLRIPEIETDGTGTIEIWPLPDAGSDFDDGEYRVYIPYIKYLAELSSPDDTSWLLTAGEQFVVAQAVSQGFAANWDEKRAQFWESYALKEYLDVVKADKTLRLSQASEFVPHTGAAGFHLGG